MRRSEKNMRGCYTEKNFYNTEILRTILHEDKMSGTVDIIIKFKIELFPGKSLLKPLTST